MFPVIDAPPTPLGYARVTVTTSPLTLAQLLAAAPALGGVVPTAARYVYILPEAVTVRWRDDGTDPTTTIGMPVYAQQAWPYLATNLTSIKLIAASSAAVNLAFYG